VHTKPSIDSGVLDHCPCASLRLSRVRKEKRFTCALLLLGALFFVPPSLSFAHASTSTVPSRERISGLSPDRVYFLRGSFNSWQSILPLERLGSGDLQASVGLVPGRYEFKIADGNWSSAFTLEASRRISPGGVAEIVESRGGEDNAVIEVRAPGTYLFRIAQKAAPGVGRLQVFFGGQAVRAPLPFEPTAKKDYIGFRTAARARDNGRGLRVYDLFSDAPQRDGAPTPVGRVVNEREGAARLRSGNDLLDGLFALTLEEAVQSETRAIQDGAFNRGGDIDCECYVTGEKWGYVWTRDTAYAARLGLAWVNPDRVWNSLAFKLSDARLGPLSGEEIVQDTGSGGSWPVSTDRVAWALGAQAVLEAMPAGAVRSERLRRAYGALRNTLERDRQGVFDMRDGLYRGEQSFLDWREQTYPLWTKQDVAPIAASKSLSTNAVHLLALQRAVVWAREIGSDADARRYSLWAGELRTQMRSKFYDSASSTLRGLRLGTAFPATLPDRFELLGTSLAVLAGVVSPDEARQAFSRYPVSDAGAPVSWPQSAEVPIYHNRASWPFVSAFAAQAAATVRHAPFAARQMESVVRGAALHLSNMENLEFTTGLAQYFDGVNTGPVINSRRQLWSVGAFLSIVRDGLFGVRVENGALSLSPYIPASFAVSYLSSNGEVRLENLPVGGRRVSLSLVLPRERTGDSRLAYDTVRAVRVNGSDVGTGPLRIESLPDNALIEVELASAAPAMPRASLTALAIDNPFEPSIRESEAFLSPVTPYISSLSKTPTGVRVELDARGAVDTVFDVYRDGILLRERVSETTFQDSDIARVSAQRCYFIVQRRRQGGPVSHPSPETCLAVGPSTSAFGRISRTGANGFLPFSAGQERFESFDYRAPTSGPHLISFLYSNSHNDISTGITAATRMVRIVRQSDGSETARGVVVMPHLPRWDTRAASSGLVADLAAGSTYRIHVDSFFNMSYLSHYDLYDGAGGRGGPLNESVLHEAFVAPLETP